MSQIASLAQTSREMAPNSPSLQQVFAAPREPDQLSPVAAYLASLAPGSRRTMRQSLRTVAHLLSEGRWDADQLDWAQLRYEHMLALRAYLRRTFISRFIGATGDLSLAAQIAGHKTVETTRGYDHRGEQAKAHAPDQIHIPYRQPRILRTRLSAPDA